MIPGVAQGWPGVIPGVAQECPGVAQEWPGVIPGVAQEWPGVIPGVAQEWPGVAQEWPGVVPGVVQEFDRESAHVGDKRTARDPVNATEEQIARAPVGNLSHRLWKGECLKPSRVKMARKEDLVVTRTCDVAGHPAWERGLSVRPPLPKCRQSKVETFNWYVKPAALPLQGDVYPDGSYLDGIVKETGRCGWAFVVIGVDGTVSAAAYGVPPPWIQDIGGAEAWAIFQAMLVTIPSLCRYWPDCLPVHLAVQKGAVAARDPRNVLARIHGMIMTAMEDSPREVVGWMPSHLTEADLELQMAFKSDGSLVNRQDLGANGLADTLAKKGVEFHRVASSDVKIWADQMERTKDRAKWIGTATLEANDMPAYPFSDSESSRWRADAAQRARANARNGVDGRRRRRPRKSRLTVGPSEGGHDVVRSAAGGGWICKVCFKRSVTKWKLTAAKCGGASTSRREYDGTMGSGKSGERQNNHMLLKAGTVTWCGTCGAFAETKANRLRRACMGPPPQQHGTGGMRSQLVLLRAGLHPATRERLPQSTWMDGTALRSLHGYARRQECSEVIGEQYRPYEVETFQVAKVHLFGGKTAEAKMRMLKGRAKCKERRAARAQREFDALVGSFIRKVEADGNEHQPDDESQRRSTAPEWALMEADRVKREEDSMAAVFWNSLGDAPAGRIQLRCIPEEPARWKSGTVHVDRQGSAEKQVRQRVGRNCQLLTCFDFGCNGVH